MGEDSGGIEARPGSPFAGEGDLVSGAVTGSGELLTLPNAGVSVAMSSGVQLAAHVHNATAIDLSGVHATAGAPTPVTLAAGETTVIGLRGSDPAELELQILPAATPPGILVTITISAYRPDDGGPVSFVGQAFTGGV